MLRVPAFLLSGSSVKPVREEAKASASGESTALEPRPPQTEEECRAIEDEVDSPCKPQEPSASTQNAPPTIPTNSPQGGAASTMNSEDPVSLQNGRRQENAVAPPSTCPPDAPTVESQDGGEDQPLVPRLGCAADASESNVPINKQSSSTLSEALFNGDNSQITEKSAPGDPIDNCVMDQLNGGHTLVADIDMDGVEGNGGIPKATAEDKDKVSHDKSSLEVEPIKQEVEPIKQEGATEERESVMAKNIGQGEVVSGESSVSKGDETSVSEIVQPCSAAGELDPEDVPSSLSEALPASSAPLQKESKKRQKLFKRSKKKSNEGNPCLSSNKVRVRDASLFLTCFIPKSFLIGFVFLLCFTFYCVH